MHAHPTVAPGTTLPQILGELCLFSQGQYSAAAFYSTPMALSYLLCVGSTKNSINRRNPQRGDCQTREEGGRRAAWGKWNTFFIPEFGAVVLFSGGGGGRSSVNSSRNLPKVLIFLFCTWTLKKLQKRGSSEKGSLGCSFGSGLTHQVTGPLLLEFEI